MKAIDAVIDSKPTEKQVMDIANLRIRNLDAFRELKSLNDTGKFLYVHPLIKNFSIREELKELLKSKPDEFLQEYANVEGNVKRYSSFLKNKNRSKKQLDRDKGNLKKHQEKRDLMTDILKEHGNA